MLVYVVQVQIFDVSVASSRSLSISSKFLPVFDNQQLTYK